MVSNPRLSLFYKSEIKKKERKRTLYTNERMRGTKNRLRASDTRSKYFLRERKMLEGKIAVHDSFDRNVLEIIPLLKVIINMSQ